MKILVINGPNLNMLGIREPQIYGSNTYENLCEMIESFADKNDIDIDIFQSNFEGEIVEKIQKALDDADGIVINPAAYTHTSVAILDALKAVNIPAVEVHISDVDQREEFRKLSYVSYYCEEKITGLGFLGYIKAIEYLISKLG